MSCLLYIAESNPLAARQLCEHLAQETGFEVCSFQSLAELEKATRERQPEACLIRLEPGDVMDSDDFFATDAMVTMAMVGQQDSEAQQQAFAIVGPLRTILLPWQPLDLLPKLHAALEKQSLVRELSRVHDQLSRGEKQLLASQENADHSARVLETATTRLARAEQLAAVGRVVTGIAHEIGTQLALVGYAEAIKSRVDPSSELYEFADAIALAQKRLATTVDQIRSFTGVEQSTALLEPASLVAVVDEALMILRYDPDVKARIIDRKDTAHPLVSLRREQIDQVVINLVTNAVLATKPGDTIGVQISEDEKAQVAILTIEDGGEGMSAEVLERLGEPFFTTRGDRGSGLGIGMCMSIVRAHGGSIMYVSEEGVGTIAKVRLPLLIESPNGSTGLG